MELSEEVIDRVFLSWMYPMGFISEEKREEILERKDFRGRLYYPLTKHSYLAGYQQAIQDMRAKEQKYRDIIREIGMKTMSGEIYKSTCHCAGPVHAPECGLSKTPHF